MTACIALKWRARLACLLLLLPAAVAAQPIDLQLTLVSNLRSVVDITNAGDGSGRLFLVRQNGTIYINDGGEDILTPFLDIRNQVEDSGNEQGLLSLAFAPDYALELTGLLGFAVLLDMGWVWRKDAQAQ